MLYQINQLIISCLFFFSCNTGKLKIVADISNDLNEVSAIEIIPNSNLFWVIEDAGNQNNLYGLDKHGNIIKSIDISNAKNNDWEDLTSDKLGNIYIGDFGNNKETRDNFTIYKVSQPEKIESHTHADTIHFDLPDELKSKDFESFFLLEGYFYILSKEPKSCFMIKVPNQIGNHTAVLVTDFNLDGKHNKITSADISDDGKTVVLLNHDKLWKLSQFKPDNFFKGKVEELKFDHNSQKEGICFKNGHSVYISDERNGTDGNNIYSFSL